MNRRLFVQSLAQLTGAVMGFLSLSWLKQADPKELTPADVAKLRANGVPLLIEQDREGMIVWHDEDWSTLRFSHVNHETSKIVVARSKHMTIEYQHSRIPPTFPRAWIDDFQKDHAKLYEFMQREFWSHGVNQRFAQAMACDYSDPFKVLR